jgi:hypothetical protein
MKLRRISGPIHLPPPGGSARRAERAALARRKARGKPAFFGTPIGHGRQRRDRKGRFA